MGSWSVCGFARNWELGRIGRELGIDVRDDRNKDHWIGGLHIHIPIPGTGVKHIPVKEK
jgi:hypothetical protein